MIQRGVDTVDTDSIDTELLKEWEVTLACRIKSEGINEGRRFAERVVGRGNDGTLATGSV
jgi:hypothetical protein